MALTFMLHRSREYSVLRLKRFAVIIPSTVAEPCKTAQDFVNGHDASVHELLLVFQLRHSLPRYGQNKKTLHSWQRGFLEPLFLRHISVTDASIKERTTVLER